MKKALFYDPYPNDGTGCTEPLPVSIKCYLDSIDGLVAPIDEIIKALTDIEPDATVEDHDTFISFGLGKHYPYCREFNWRAIRYIDLT